MKNKKLFIILTFTILIIISVFSACSTGTDETVAENTTVSTNIEKTTEQPSQNPQTSNDQSQSEITSANNNSSSGNGSNASSNSGSRNNASNGSGSSSSKSTTKKQTTTKRQTTTKKETTTKKQTTTKKETTTVKHVSAKDVQNQVNSYIKSKGITLDSSMTPSNASWSGQISGLQSHLNDGSTLKNCKEYVDIAIEWDNANTLYCYYEGTVFYILYW